LEEDDIKKVCMAKTLLNLKNIFVLIISESLVYGIGPLLWGFISYTEVKAYPSSLALAVRLCLISCIYSTFALTSQMITRVVKQKKKSGGSQRQPGGTRVYQEENTDAVIQ